MSTKIGSQQKQSPENNTGGGRTNTSVIYRRDTSEIQIQAGSPSENTRARGGEGFLTIKLKARIPV